MKYPNIWKLAGLIAVLLAFLVAVYIFSRPDSSTPSSIDNKESTSAPSGSTTLDYTSMRVAVNNPEGDDYCVAFYGSEADPTVVQITNCGAHPVTLRSDKVFAPELAVGQVRMYNIPAGYLVFEAGAYREDGTLFGHVDFN